jgi:hypothetical protein
VRAAEDRDLEASAAFAVGAGAQSPPGADGVEYDNLDVRGGELLDEHAAGVRLACAALREDRDRLAGDLDR